MAKQYVQGQGCGSCGAEVLSWEIQGCTCLPLQWGEVAEQNVVVHGVHGNWDTGSLGAFLEEKSDIFPVACSALAQ